MSQLSPADGPRSAVAGPPPAARADSLSAVLTHLHRHGPLTRTRLAALTGRNRSTIAALVGRLVECGAAEETPGEPDGATGRPSLLVRPRSDAVQVMAVDVSGEGVTGALVGLGGAVLARTGISLPDPWTTPAGARTMADLVVATVTALEAHPLAHRPLGLGVAVPGVVDVDSGVVALSPTLGWSGEPLGEMLADARPDLPVLLGNDADLGLLSELRHGAARDGQDVVYLSAGAGVGGGMVSGGQRVRGASGYAGEVGHVLVRPGGRRCRCGARGCWETEVGPAALARALGTSPAAAALVAGLDAERERRTGRLDEVATWLGVGVAALVTLLNPRSVVFGGLLREVFVVEEPLVRAVVARHTLAPALVDLRLLPASAGDGALSGAAELVWDHVLADPVTFLGA
ncbi:MAG: ROK family transcriptional regulator [Kineosporiaceae bacterium]